MKAQFPWMVLLIAVCLEPMPLGLERIQVAAAEPAANPIVLHYKDTPIFLGAHEQAVTAIAFSPDGQTIVSGANDGYVRFWDVATGRLKSIHGDDATRGIYGLAISPDFRSVAVVGGLFGREAMLWDTSSGQIRQEFEDPANEAFAASPNAAPFLYKGKPIVFRLLNGVAFSPDGRLLATAPGGVLLRDVASGKIVATLQPPAKGIKTLAFSPDGKILAAAGEDKAVRLWDISAGALESTLEGPTQPLSSVAISPDGTRIAAVGSGNRSFSNSTPAGYLWIWDRPGGAARRIELGGVAAHQVAFVGRDRVVVAAGHDLWSVDLRGGDPITPRKVWSHSMEVLTVAVSPDQRLVASGGEDRAVDLIDFATGKLVQRLPGLMDGISAVATSADGKRFATATMDRRFTNYLPLSQARFAARYKSYFSDAANAGRLQASEVRIWSAEDGRLQAMLPLPTSQVTAIDFIPHTSQLAVAGWTPEKGGMLSIWNLDDRQRVRDLASSTAEVLSITVSPDGRILASGDADGNLELWELPSGTKARSHKFDAPVEAVTFSADGKFLAAGDANRTVRVFDPSSGSIGRTMKCRSRFESLEFSPDATLLAAGTRVPGLELWDLRAGGASRTLKAPGDKTETEEIRAGFVAFSPDGRYVVFGGLGKDIAVFDVANGMQRFGLKGHFHPATAAAFLPDGRLVSGGSERTVRLWDTNLGSMLATWIVVPADASRNWADEWVGFTPSGQFLGSTPIDRLVGWQSGGDVTNRPEDADRRRRVENLFKK